MAPFIRLCIALLLLAFAPNAHAQGWMDKHPELGLSLPRLDNFEALPTQPEERFVVLQYVEAEKKPRQAGEATQARGTCFVVIVPHAASQRSDPVNGEAYLDTILPDWSRQVRRGRKTRFGYESRGFDLSSGDGRRVGYVHLWAGEERDVLWVGICAQERKTKLIPWYRSVGERIKFTEVQGNDSERGKLERLYSGRRLLDTEGRIEVRLALVDQWEVKDTEHYIVLHHASDALTLNLVASNLEYVRSELSRDHPQAKQTRQNPDKVTTVRICRDRVEYLAYGGWEGSAGYWNPGAGELVLYDPRTAGGSEQDLWVTLYHEACHQYIHQATGGVVPNSWFDEGLADYYSGAVMEGGRIRRVDPHPWRTEYARQLVRENKRASLAELLATPRTPFYADSARNYALAWSFVFFLRSEESRSRSDYGRILPNYYRGLQDAFERESQSRGSASSAGRLKKASERAREQAYEGAFANIDMTRLEQDWKLFVRSLQR